MNKRIIDLLEKSKLFTYAGGLVYDLHNDYGVDMDKFVELLIEECALMAESLSRSHSDGDAGSGCAAVAAALRMLNKNE